MPPTPARLFVSYASRDAERVHDVVSFLREQGLTVWLDQAKIAAGDDVVARIDEGLSDWRYFLLFASRAYFESAWAAAEYRAAFYAAVGADDRKILIVRLDDVELPALIASKRFVRFTTAESVAAEVAELIRTADAAADGPRPRDVEPGLPTTASQPLDWSTATDSVIQTTIKEILQRRSDLKGFRRTDPVFVIEVGGGKTLRVSVSAAALEDELLWLDLSSEVQNYGVVAKIAASLRRRLLQGGLGIFEGPFEVELEQRQLQLGGIRNTLVEQLAAVTRGHLTVPAAGGPQK